jgi:hypothetical protein
MCPLVILPASFTYVKRPLLVHVQAFDQSAAKDQLCRNHANNSSAESGASCRVVEEAEALQDFVSAATGTRNGMSSVHRWLWLLAWGLWLVVALRCLG